jgi:hypothetical protein
MDLVTFKAYDSEAAVLHINVIKLMVLSAVTVLIALIYNLNCTIH